MNAPTQQPGLYRIDFEDKDGKMVEVKKDEIYGWVPVHKSTGRVDLSDFQQWDDGLYSLSPEWEWRRFTLISAPPKFGTWLDMRDAPRDGSKILMLWGNGEMEVCAFSASRGTWVISSTHILAPLSPKGWMPLPNIAISKP